MGQISLEECEFYHSMTLPSGEVRGQWDLRPRTAEYLGHTAFAGCSVLEIGPASGYLSFHMEKLGAQVTCIEPSMERLWDAVPLAGFDVAGWQDMFRPHIAGVRKSFWYCHDLFGSRVRVVEAEPYRLPDDLGRFDIGLLGSVLLHCRAPFQIMEEVGRLVADRVIVTDAYDAKLGTEPVCRFYPGIGESQVHTWWQFTPQFIVAALKTLGFPHAEVSFHDQWYDLHGYSVPMFTVVARRRP